MARMASITLMLLLGSIGISAQGTYRTVIDKEEGSIFQQPLGFPATDYGFDDGTVMGLDPAAIRSVMTHFAQFCTGEETWSAGFPYSKLKTYEAQETAQGRAPFFVTATYMGKKRPVYFSWSLVLVNNKPTAASNLWQYAVNFQDPRFIRFWLSQYMQPLLANYQLRTDVGPNLWFHIDQGSYEYSLYGVLDDNNNFVPGVTWDQPFPQNQNDFETAVETFYAQVKALAPDLHLIVNLGQQADPTHFPALMANAGGGMLEDLYQWRSQPDAYDRNLWYSQNFQFFSWLASQNRVTALRAMIPSSDPEGLLTSFIVYSLLKGPNSFFAPGDTNGNSLPPSTWSAWRAQLGDPVTPLAASGPNSTGPGFRLYSRSFQGGIVYLNGTGTTQTIPLSPSVAYYDPNGALITSHSIQLPDATGTYVTTTPTALSQPSISPRYSGPAAGPVMVTMETSTPGAAIHYTIDGSTPTTASPLYSGPVPVNATSVVTARAFMGSASSQPESASYTINNGTPTAQMLLASDTGPAGIYYPVVTLSAIPTSPVKVFYIVQNGSPASGTYTFPAGMASGTFPVTSGSTGSMIITLTSASGANLGTNPTLTYNVGVPANSTQAPVVQPVVTAGPAVVSATPSSGTGASQVFQFAFSDSNGAANMSLAGVMIAPYIAMKSVCYVFYKPSTNMLYLENDTGDLAPSMTPGSSVTISNSQCSINGAGSTVTVSGTSLVMNLPITFSPTYTGQKTIYMRAVESATSATEWVSKATWKP